MGTPWEFWRWAEGGEVKEHVWWWPMWSYMLLGRVSLRSWQHLRPTSLEVQTNFGAQSCLSGLRHKAAALLTEEKRDLTQNARAYVRHHFSFDLSFLQSPVSVLFFFFFSRIEIESSKSERRKKPAFSFIKGFSTDSRSLTSTEERDALYSFGHIIMNLWSQPPYPPLAFPLHYTRISKVNLALYYIQSSFTQTSNSF